MGVGGSMCGLYKNLRTVDDERGTVGLRMLVAAMVEPMEYQLLP